MTRTPGIARPIPGGFTLVELIVVLVLMAVITGVIAPRLVSGASRSAEADVRRAAEILSAAGRRDTLTSQQIAIDFDSQSSQLKLLVLRMPSAIDAARGAAPEWIDDPMTMHVELKDVKLLSAAADGAALDPGKFRIEFRQSGVRPSVLLTFGQSEDRPAWTVSLPPGAFRAKVTAGEDRFADVEQTAIDLDRSGKAEEPW
jgi:prepilin-type N-terminal cleavage/methylation domain-containing protein